MHNMGRWETMCGWCVRWSCGRSVGESCVNGFVQENGLRLMNSCCVSLFHTYVFPFYLLCNPPPQFFWGPVLLTCWTFWIHTRMPHWKFNLSMRSFLWKDKRSLSSTNRKNGRLQHGPRSRARVKCYSLKRRIWVPAVCRINSNLGPPAGSSWCCAAVICKPKSSQPGMWIGIRPSMVDQLLMGLWGNVRPTLSTYTYNIIQ